MNEVITEKNYPIQTRWVIKDIIVAIPVFFFGVEIVFSYILRLFRSNTNQLDFASLLKYYLIATIGLLIFATISMFWRRKNYHYTIEDKFLLIQQGIFSKQQRHIPYGVIQNIFLKQDLFDRIVNTASLTIENASQGGGNPAPQEEKIFGIRVGNRRAYRDSNIEMIGFSKNKVGIPGLAKQDAETLKNIVLQKMRENPIDDSQSGL